MNDDAAHRRKINDDLYLNKCYNIQKDSNCISLGEMEKRCDDRTDGVARRIRINSIGWNN